MQFVASSRADQNRSGLRQQSFCLMPALRREAGGQRKIPFAASDGSLSDLPIVILPWSWISTPSVKGHPYR
jgi:hypothetical protein